MDSLSKKITRDRKVILMSSSRRKLMMRLFIQSMRDLQNKQRVYSLKVSQAQVSNGYSQSGMEIVVILHFHC